MILYVIVDDKTYPIEVPEDVLKDGKDFFQKMDRDLDKGWQMSRDWVSTAAGRPRGGTSTIPVRLAI